MKGHLEKNGTKNSNFNGTMSLLLTDALQHVVCKLNNKSSDGAKVAYEYDDYTSQLFRGDATITNGEFSISFVMPVNILYSDEPGLMSLYAASNDGQELYNGISNHFTIGETDLENASQISPSITCYLDNPDFKNGDMVNATPRFYATIEMPNGINTTGCGIGRQMKLVIDNNAKTTYNLTSIFKPETDSYTSGKLEYTIPALSDGNHELSISVYDALDNIAQKTLSFQVKTDYEPELLKAWAVSEIARSSASFVVSHNNSGRQVRVELDVTDAEGKPVWSYDETGVPAEATSRVGWNLKDSKGQPVPAGVYWWRFRITNDDTCKMSEPSKLIVVR